MRRPPNPVEERGKCEDRAALSGLMYVIEPDGAISVLSKRDYAALPTKFADTLIVCWSPAAAFIASDDVKAGRRRAADETRPGVCGRCLGVGRKCVCYDGTRDDRQLREENDR